MKSRLSVTIDKRYVQALHQISRQEKRSISKQVEQAVAEWLKAQNISDQIPTTPGNFAGKFSREETYADD